MRVLLIGHSYVWREYHRKLEVLCKRHRDLEAFVLVPSNIWPDRFNRQRRLEVTRSRHYTVIAGPVLFSGSFWRYLFLNPGLHLGIIRPDIIHVELEPMSLMFLEVFLARRLFRSGAKIVFSAWQNLDLRYRIPYRWVERVVLARTDHAIAGTEAAAAVLRRKGYRGRLTINPHMGVDIEAFRPDATRAGADGVFTIGYVGKLVREKGVDLVLRAVAGLPGSWELQLVGDGVCRDSLLALAGELNIADRVRLCLPVDYDAMPGVFQGLDAVVLPSRTGTKWKEQFGFVLMEAMASGVPVVGSDSGEIPKVLGNAGLIFRNDDSISLREKLAQLNCDVELRRELGRRGRERAVSEYANEVIADRIYHVYEQVLEDGR